MKEYQELLGLKEYPLGIYYTNNRPDGVTPKPGIHSCMIGLLQNARKKGEGVSAPFGSGCSAILTYPLREAGNEKPHAILGMFDVSARPMVEKDVLTLAMPYALFLKLVENLSGSFLETESWRKVLRRIHGR